MMSKCEPYILVLGVSVYDIFGFTYHNYRPQDSNPGRVRVSFGGVCRNIAENMARLELNTKFISLIGDDEKGNSIRKHAEMMQLDMSDTIVIEGESTPTYMAILSEHGEMESAIVDMNITDKLTKEHIDERAHIIRNAEYMVLDTDNPIILEHIVTTYANDTKFILDPVSAAKVSKVKHLLKYFHTIKPNRHEAEVLCGFRIETAEDVKKAGAYFRSLGIKHIFISLDSDGIYYNCGSKEGIIKADHVDVVNVTGAGDSCVAGLGYGYMHGLDIIETVKYAIVLSAITISHEETIHPDMGLAIVNEYMEKMEWSEVVFS